MKKLADHSVSVVVPVHNEYRHIHDLLPEIYGLCTRLKRDFELLIVENGSKDGTGVWLKNNKATFPKLRVIHLKTANYGLAVKTGFIKAKKDALLLFDLDYFDEKFARDSLKLMTKYDAVVGSKNSKDSKDTRHFSRKIISNFFTFLIRFIFRYPLSDTHGMKALKRKTFKKLITKCKMEREIFDTELLIRAAYKGLKLTEIPVFVKEKRPSRSSILRRIPRTFVDLFRLKLVLLKE